MCDLIGATYCDLIGATYCDLIGATYCDLIGATYCDLIGATTRVVVCTSALYINTSVYPMRRVYIWQTMG